MRTFHIAYTSKGKEHVRVEYADDEKSALQQAQNHFNMFGYGDETGLEVIFP